LVEVKFGHPSPTLSILHASSPSTPITDREHRLRERDRQRACGWNKSQTAIERWWEWEKGGTCCALRRYLLGRREVPTRQNGGTCWAEGRYLLGRREVYLLGIKEVPAMQNGGIC
jgi:hypothetical protein